MKIAVFDIGTNSIHMLVVEIHDDLSFEILDHEKDVTRLGDGSFEKKRLLKPVIQRALSVIERFDKIAKKHGVKRTVAVATSAVREARNSGDFLKAVYKRTGIRVRVISGEEEGRLIYLAARASVETHGRRALVIDIGGGSVELILGDARGHESIGSYKLGVSRLTDHFIHSDPPSRKEISRLEEHIEEELRGPVKELRRRGYSMVIGTAGTMVAMAAVSYQRRRGKPLQFLNHFELSAKDLARTHERLLRMGWKERLKVPGLEAKRADIIVAGSTLLTTLMRVLKVRKITISDKGIREGIILDFIEKNRKSLKVAHEEADLSIRERSVRQLARRCAVAEGHAEQTARLALALFDKTVTLHGLSAKERELLRYASLLHDLGHYVSFRKHHKHSYYLIVNSDLDGFTHEEIETIARVAKHHRKPMAKKDLRELASGASRTVGVLAALLRVADGLDRSHFSVIGSLECKIAPHVVTLSLTTRRDAELEVWQARERADLFEHIFKRRLELQLAAKKR